MRIARSLSLVARSLEGPELCAGDRESGGITSRSRRFGMWKSEGLVGGVVMKKQRPLFILVSRLYTSTTSASEKVHLFLSNHPSFSSKLERLLRRAQRCGKDFVFDGLPIRTREDAVGSLCIIFQQDASNAIDKLRSMEAQVDQANHRLKHPDGCRWCRHCKPKP